MHKKAEIRHSATARMPSRDPHRLPTELLQTHLSKNLCISGCSNLSNFLGKDTEYFRRTNPSRAFEVWERRPCEEIETYEFVDPVTGVGLVSYDG